MSKIKPIPQPELDLDGLLSGACLGANAAHDAKVREFFRIGEFCDEHYLVAAIEFHLLTEAQRRLMFDHKLTIEKMLNGRYGTDAEEAAVNQIYAEWNAKLGFQKFGF